jgi:DNA-binding winged helix-turn-helix (wHTH) protein/TolB-like protein
MSKENKHLYQFGKYRINVVERLLQRPEGEVALPPKAFDLLLALVKRHGQVVTKDQLMNEIWPDTVVEETNLKVYVSQLRKALDDEGKGVKFIETLPKRGYRFTAPVTELVLDGLITSPPPQLLIEKQSVAQVVIEEQFEEQAPLRVLPPVIEARRVRARWPVLALSGLLIGLILLGWLIWARRGNWAGQIESLAVLPFTTLASPQDEEHLGLGLADALITRLSNTGGVVVRPTSAVQKFIASDRDPVALGQKLAVDAVLDGRLQRSGEQFRLTVQLVRISDGRPLWAASFEEPNGSAFRLQQAVSERLAHALTLKLSAGQQQRLKQDYTTNAAAYEAYTRGRYFYGKQSKESFEKALGYFRQAIELDPNYALAWTGIADCYNAQSTTITSLGATPHREMFAAARAAAERALELDDSLADAHVSLGAAVAEDDSAMMHREIQRALTLNPNLAQAHNVYALMLFGEGRLADGLAEIERARALDPLSLSINTNQGVLLFRAHQYEEAISQFHRVLEMDQNFPRAYYGLGMVLGELRRYPEAIVELQKAVELSRGGSVPLSALGYVYAVSGRRAEAQRVLAQLLELHKQNLASPFYIALVYNGLADKEQAFTWLEKIKGGSLMRLARVDQRFDNLRTDPRFETLLPQR